MKPVTERSDETVVHGFFWVPAAPEKKVGGTLRFGSPRGISLELSGDPLAATPRQINEQERLWHGRRHVIFGTSDGQNESFTVPDALAHAIGPQLKFVADHLLWRRHLKDPEAASFFHLQLEADHLEAWAGGATLEKCLDAGDSKFQAKTLFSFETAAGRHALLAHSFPYWKERETGVTYTCSFESEFSAPLALQGVARELEKFLSLATILTGTRARPRSVHLREQDEDMEPVELIATWGPEDGREIWPSDTLVPLAHLGPAAPDVFAKWYADWPLLRYCVEMFLSAFSVDFGVVKFVCLISGLEAFHRATEEGKLIAEDEFTAWRTKLVATLPPDMPSALRDRTQKTYEYLNEASLRARLRELLAKAGVGRADYSQRSAKAFVEFVVNTRNQLAHGLQRPSNDMDVIRANQDMTMLFLRLLLMRLGCGNDVIVTATRRLCWSRLVGGRHD
jgi:hypothetical protein